MNKIYVNIIIYALISIVYYDNIIIEGMIKSINFYQLQCKYSLNLINLFVFWLITIGYRFI